MTEAVKTAYLSALTAQAVKAFFERVRDGQATAAEYGVLPEMIDRYAGIAAPFIAPETVERFDNMSLEGRRGEFPSEGLVSAEEVCNFLGKNGIKKKTESLVKLARQGKLPMPVAGFHPQKWDAREIRTWYDSLKTGGVKHADRKAFKVA